MRRLTIIFPAFLWLSFGVLFGAGFDVHLPEPFEPDTVLWVAPDGDDKAAGTESAPLASLAGAARAAAAAKQAEPEKSIGVYFKEGVYRLTEPALFNRLVSPGEKPILFRSAPGAKGKCIFTGKTEVTGWEKLASSEYWKHAPESLKTRIRPEAVEKIWTAPYAPYESALYAPDQDGTRQEFFVDGRPQTLARWPNEGFAVSGQAVGPTPVETRDWRPEGTREGIFEADANQPVGWKNEPAGILFGYWYWDWSESYVRIEKITHEDNRQIIELCKPYDASGYKHRLRYYGLNLLCELDAPGEFYIDRETKRIFWIPADGVEPAVVSAALTTYEKPWVLEISHCGGILFAGLVFDGGFGGLASVDSSEDITFADIEARGFSGRTAVMVSGGARCGAYHTRLETLGGGGFTLYGGDRKTLTEAEHFLSQCTVHDFSRIFRTYAPAALINGCGIKVEHCDFSEASSSAMRMEGNELLVEYCRFTDLVRESDDQGGIDSWFNPTYRGNVIRYNHWENIVGGTTCGAAAVRLDDMISGFLIYGNIFIHCGGVHFGAVQIHGGKENRIENNLFVDCRAAVSFSRWGTRYTDAFAVPGSQHYDATRHKCHEEVEIDSPAWRERYPSLVRIDEDADVNTVINNIVINCEDFLVNPGEMQQTENNTIETLQDVDTAKLLAPDTLKKYGLNRIPVEEIGVTGKPYLDR